VCAASAARFCAAYARTSTRWVIAERGVKREPAARVATGLVVADQQVGVFLFQDRGEPGGGLADVRPDEPLPVGRIGEQDRAVAAVRIAQMHDLGRSQRRRGVRELVQAAAAAGTGFPAVRRAHDPVRRHDEDHPVALSGQHRQRSAGQQRLIVGMGMKADDRGHGSQGGMHRRRASSDRPGPMS
jgi:hypothetical protein